VKKAEIERLRAAEDVCWSLLLMMKLGGLDISHSWRQYLAKDVQKWVDRAVATGVMKEGGDAIPEDEFMQLLDRVDKLERKLGDMERDPGPPQHTSDQR
jgi:hypothetical protein